MQTKIGSQSLAAGAATVDITPGKPMSLYGYPHVPRLSTGVGDPLLSVAVCLESAGSAVLCIANDVIFVSRATTARVRDRVSAETGIPAGHILIGATHTHSGPATVDYVSNSDDPTVPKVDAAYLACLEDAMSRAAIQAWQSRRPAEAAFISADATGIGTNRHHPDGPSDLSVPVLGIRDRATGEPIALLLVCTMHPTVLHADSTLVSGDFPAYARSYLQQNVVGASCPIAYFMGAAGDQSPRHVTRANTFAEAERIGHILGRAVETALGTAHYTSHLPLAAGQAWVDLPRRVPPPLAEAEQLMHHARARLEQKMRDGSPAADVRTAECDLFGAEETVAIARAAEQGRLTQALADCLPAEIQVLAIGSHRLVGWPGEFFVEFAARLRDPFPEAHVISCANGDLQGYIVTQEAVDQQRYEAGNALLRSPDAGQIVVDRTIALLQALKHTAAAGT
jgi:hypothetical protein